MKRIREINAEKQIFEPRVFKKKVVVIPAGSQVLSNIAFMPPPNPVLVPEIDRDFESVVSRTDRKTEINTADEEIEVKQSECRCVIL